MTHDELIAALATSSSWCARHVERIEELEAEVLAANETSE